MSFRESELLWLLLVIPVLAGLPIFAWWRRRRATARFGNPENANWGLRASKCDSLRGLSPYTFNVYPRPRPCRNVTRRIVYSFVAPDYDDGLCMHDGRFVNVAKEIPS